MNTKVMNPAIPQPINKMANTANMTIPASRVIELGLFTSQISEDGVAYDLYQGDVRIHRAYSFAEEAYSFNISLDMLGRRLVVVDMPCENQDGWMPEGCKVRTGKFLFVERI